MAMGDVNILMRCDAMRFNRRQENSRVSISNESMCDKQTEVVVLQ